MEVWGVLVCDNIAEEFFCCDYEKCKGGCCKNGDFGAPVTDNEDAEITKSLTDIAPYLTKRNRRWVASHGVSGFVGEIQSRCININPYDKCPFCTFGNKNKAMCSLQKISENGAKNLKPSSCKLAPIIVSEFHGHPMLAYVKYRVCEPGRIKGKREKTRVYQFLKEPLIEHFGKEWYEELSKKCLEHIKKQHQSQNGKYVF